MTALSRTQLAPLLFLALLLALSPVDCIRLYKSRPDALALLGAKETRIHFNSCEMSSNRSSCIFAMDTSTNQEPTQCAMSDLETRPWWLAVLETPAYVTKVTVLNIDPTYRSYQDGLSSMVLMANDDVCFRYESREMFVKRTFPCDAIADQITIQSNLENAIMAICDVEVIGAVLRFPTVLEGNAELLVHSCSQSSIDGTGYCENAFDQDTNSNHAQKPCSVTQLEQSPWLEVILMKPSIVNEVLIFNRGDCCADGLKHIRVTLNTRLCSEYNGPAIAVVSASCKYFGNAVRIESQQNMSMSVCEVQLMGHPAAIGDQENFKPLGCFNDTLGDHDLAELVSSTKMSLNKCYRMCKRLNLKYFGVQNGKHCFCGSSFGKHGRADDKSCSVVCDGDPSEECGGPRHNSVYEIVALLPEVPAGTA